MTRTIDELDNLTQKGVGNGGTTSDSVHAIRGGAIRVAGYAAGVLVSLGTATILVRYLGVPSFGRYVTVTSLIALVGGVTEAGIHVYGIREFVAHDEPNRRELLANLLSMRLALTLVGVFCAALFALSVGYGSALALGTIIAGGGLLLQVSADVLSIPLQVRLQLARLAGVDLSRRVFGLVGVGALALLDASLLPFFAASTIAAALALALLALLVRHSVTLRLRVDWDAWRELFRETLPYAVAMSIAAVYLYVTVIVMSLIATARETGLFATSFRVTQVALGVPVLLLTAIFPLLARRHTTSELGPTESIAKVLIVALVCGLWMSLVMVAGAGFAIHVIGGGAAGGATPVLQIQASVLTLSFVSASSALTLIALRLYRPMIIVSFSALVLDVVLGLALIPPLGAQGGALADVITEGIAATVLTVIVARAVPTHGISGATFRAPLLAALPAGGLLLLPLGVAFRVIVVTALFFGVLFVTGSLPEELRAAVRLVARRRPG